MEHTEKAKCTKSLEDLSSRGLIVIPHSVQQGYLREGYMFTLNITNCNGINIVDDPCKVEVYDDVLVYWNLKHDLYHRVSTWEEGFFHVYNFYYGEPSICGEWELPTHWHPEWDQDKLVKVLESPKVISKMEWRAIKEELYQESCKHRDNNLEWSERHWSERLRFQFISCPNVKTISSRLEIRRDLETAYIINE